jgi:hypothetical protein
MVGILGIDSDVDRLVAGAGELPGRSAVDALVDPGPPWVKTSSPPP